jgi:putative oxidoreductase
MTIVTKDAFVADGTRFRDWAPLPIRIALGIGLMIHGGIKLFVPGGHENISYLAGQLGTPLPDLMGWVIGCVEFFGGLGIFLGALFPVSTGLNVLNVAGLLVLGALRGGIPDPLPGGDPLPAFREALLIFAAAVTLFLGGPGRLAVDALARRREASR